MADDLEVLVGVERTVVIKGQTIVVHEVTMKNLRAFTRACTPFLAEFDEAGALGSATGSDGNPLPPEEFALFKVISEHGDAMMLATSLVSNAPIEFLERLRPDEFFKIASLVIEVNGSFFVQSLAPQLIRFARGMSLVGTMLFKASLEKDIATPT